MKINPRSSRGFFTLLAYHERLRRSPPFPRDRAAAPAAYGILPQRSWRDQNPHRAAALRRVLLPRN